MLASAWYMTRIPGDLDWAVVVNEERNWISGPEHIFTDLPYACDVTGGIRAGDDFSFCRAVTKTWCFPVQVLILVCERWVQPGLLKSNVVQNVACILR